MPRSYKDLKQRVSVAAAITGAGTVIIGGIVVSVPGEFEQIFLWFSLLGLAIFGATVLWLLCRAAFWVVELRNDISEGQGGFQLGITRLARVTAILVPIIWFFWALYAGRFPPGRGKTIEVLSTLSVYIISGGLSWLAVMTFGWVIQGFRGSSKAQ